MVQLRILFATAIACSALSAVGQAQVSAWTGLGDNYTYSQTANWDIVPPNDGSQIISFSGVSTTVYLDGGIATLAPAENCNATVAGIQVSGGSNMTLEADPASLYIGSSGISVMGGSTLTLRAPVTLTSSQTWSLCGSSTINADGTISATGCQSLTITGDGTSNVVYFASSYNNFSGGVTAANGVLLQFDTSSDSSDGLSQVPSAPERLRWATGRDWLRQAPASPWPTTSPWATAATATR